MFSLEPIRLVCKRGRKQLELEKKMWSPNRYFIVHLMLLVSKWWTEDSLVPARISTVYTGNPKLLAVAPERLIRCHTIADGLRDHHANRKGYYIATCRPTTSDRSLKIIIITCELVWQLLRSTGAWGLVCRPLLFNFLLQKCRWK